MTADGGVRSQVFAPRSRGPREECRTMPYRRQSKVSCRHALPSHVSQSDPRWTGSTRPRRAYHCSSTTRRRTVDSLCRRHRRSRPVAVDPSRSHSQCEQGDDRSERPARSGRARGQPRARHALRRDRGRTQTDQPPTGPKRRGQHQCFTLERAHPVSLALLLYARARVAHGGECVRRLDSN
jgi:hypothetical protein